MTHAELEAIAEEARDLKDKLKKCVEDAEAAYQTEGTTELETRLNTLQHVYAVLDDASYELNFLCY